MRLGRVILRAALALVSVVLVLALGAYVYVFERHGTDVAFQTSDGEWADSEVQFKGRDFSSIVFGYQLYKIQCSAPFARLERVTEPPSAFSVEALFNDYSDPKWQIPVAEPHPNLRGEIYYRPADIEHCSNRGSTMEEMQQARRRADAFLDRHTGA